MFEFSANRRRVKSTGVAIAFGENQRYLFLQEWSQAKHRGSNLTPSTQVVGLMLHQPDLVLFRPRGRTALFNVNVPGCLETMQPKRNPRSARQIRHLARRTGSPNLYFVIWGHNDGSAYPRAKRRSNMNITLHNLCEKAS